MSGDVAPREEACAGHQPKAGEILNDREATAVSFAERIALDPHTVDDAFFADVRKHFSDDEIVELVFACGIVNWGNKFNITMQLDSSPDSEYETGMAYRQEELA
ncbi:MAG: carboxymuconolactone decarboxylase family protein [Gaiellaceae bacterium]